MNVAFDIERDKKWEAEAAQLAAKQAEEKRLADIKAAEEKAAREKAEAEAEKQAEIDRLEREKQARIAEENRLLAEQKKRDEDKAHRGRVNRAIVKKIVAITGCNNESAQNLVEAVVLGEIDHISITY